MRLCSLSLCLYTCTYCFFQYLRSVRLRSEPAYHMLLPPAQVRPPGTCLIPCSRWAGLGLEAPCTMDTSCTQTWGLMGPEDSRAALTLRLQTDKSCREAVGGTWPSCHLRPPSRTRKQRLQGDKQLTSVAKLERAPSPRGGLCSVPC